jgi:glycolate oxidase FAD binding subunit
VADAVLDALPDLLRPAGDEDTVAGVPARYVAAPATTEQASAVVRVAADHDLAVVVRGAGTKLDWGPPPRRLDLVIDTRRLSGVVEHAAGDLIAVVRAGTTLEDLAAKLDPQQLAVDIPLPGATVGGTVALSTSGPRRMLYGTLRDLLIGVTVVRPDGVVAHSGGKVVKNVAGYDLGKLLTGSYGTLGLITECAFRLHPLPAATAVISQRVETACEAGVLVTSVRRSQVVPSAVEVDAPPDGGVEVAVLLEGTPAGVEQRAAAVLALLDGSVSPGPPEWWGRYPWRPGDVGVKAGVALSRVPEAVTAARAAAERYGVPVALRGSAGTGVVYAGLPGSTDPEAVAGVLAGLRAGCEHAVVLTAPPPVRDRVDMWGPVAGLGLMRRVKQQFDPDARFAPGRFVGGI